MSNEKKPLPKSGGMQRWLGALGEDTEGLEESAHNTIKGKRPDIPIESVEVPKKEPVMPLVKKKDKVAAAEKSNEKGGVVSEFDAFFEIDPLFPFNFTNSRSVRVDSEIIWYLKGVSGLKDVSTQELTHNILKDWCKRYKADADKLMSKSRFM